MFKHQEIYEVYRQKILNGELTEGSLLPTEKELCRLHEVSRITAMRALKDLTRDQYVRRVSGKGTYVCYRDTHNHFPFHLIVPDIQNKYYSEMGRRFNRFLQSRNTYGLVACGNYESDYTEMLLHSIQQCRTRGIALVPPSNEDKIDSWLQMVNNVRENLVIGSRELPGFDGYQVIVDEEKACSDAVHHFYKHGHRRIAYLGPKSSTMRYNGFVKGCEECDLNPEHCRQIENADLISLRGIKELFHSDTAPTAVIAPSEPHAIAAYDLLSSLGLKIPQQVALLGLDGGILAPSIEVPLTTIEFPGGDIGEKLAETLWQLLQGKLKNGKHGKIEKLESPLFIRASCGSNPEKYRHEYLRKLIQRVPF